MKVAFVVLHYCQVNVTIDCINSLSRLKGNPQIVVVDNASPDGSGIILKERYSGSSNVNVILNDSNLGFATANNIGYAYARKELGADVIAVLNNDTVIEDNDFIVKLLSSPFVHRYHIIAPDIVNKEGKHQNPYSLKPKSYDRIIKDYRKLKLLLSVYSIPVIGDLKAIIAFSHKKLQVVPHEDECEMIVPHGAAIIYSPLWTEKENFAFFPGTFMYGEELLLYYYIMCNKYKTIYYKELEIYHLEDVATNARFFSKRKKKLFQTKCQLKSYKLLIDYITHNSLFVP